MTRRPVPACLVFVGNTLKLEHFDDDKLGTFSR